jgi:hypothetical protein
VLIGRPVDWTIATARHASDRPAEVYPHERHVSTYSGHGDRLDRARLLRAIARAREAKVMTEDDAGTLVALVELVGGRLS